MSLSKKLRKQNYDLIEGPIRDQKLLQIWIKRPLQGLDLGYQQVSHAFKSNVIFNPTEDAALIVDSADKDEYSFNIGITFLEELLKTLALGNLELSAKIKSGRQVTISYEDPKTSQISSGELDNYFFNADFLHVNPRLFKDANRNNLIIISGLLTAKNLLVEIKTDFVIDATLEATLNQLAEGKAEFSGKGTSALKMSTKGDSRFPVAIKAHKLDFDKGKFSKSVLVTDTRTFFD